MELLCAAMVDIEKLYKAADKHLKDRQLRSALATFQKIYKRDPDQQKALLHIGELSLRLHRTADAARHMLRLADFYIKRDDPSRAIATCRKILKLDPGNPRALSKLQGLLTDSRQGNSATRVKRGKASHERKSEAPQRETTPLNRLPETDKKSLRALEKGLRLLRPKDLLPQTACPDSWTLASYLSGRLDEKTQREINAHIAFCDSCYEDYAALAGPEKITDLLLDRTKDERSPAQVAETREVKEMDTVKQHIMTIDLRSPYAATIAQKQPSGQRGDAAPGLILPKSTGGSVRPTRIAKTKISLGPYDYRVYFSASPDRFISCTLEPVMWRIFEPVNIVVVSGTGHALLSKRTDERGYCQFSLLGLEGDSCIICFSVEKNIEVRLQVLVPRRRAPRTALAPTSFRHEEKDDPSD